MEDFDFSISTSGLTDKGNDIAKEAGIIRQALADIDAARKSLEGWVSVNKEKYDAKIAEVLPAMSEMADVIDSFGGVAVQTSSRAEAAEEKIAAAIDNVHIG